MAESHTSRSQIFIIGVSMLRKTIRNLTLFIEIAKSSVSQSYLKMYPPNVALLIVNFSILRKHWKLIAVAEFSLWNELNYHDILNHPTPSLIVVRSRLLSLRATQVIVILYRCTSCFGENWKISRYQHQLLPNYVTNPILRYSFDPYTYCSE